MVEQETRPLVIRCPEGRTVDVALCNEKAFQKSIEQNRLWVVHSETGRVLPYEPDPTVVGLSEGAGWYEAVVSCDEPAEDYPREDASSGRDCGAAAWAETLSTLTAVIAQRKRDLPEGSYTTHLFTSGLDKIKKKTGEEAVELILARDGSETTYEAADLVYHLLVLLEAAEVPFADVIQELRRRT